MCGIAGFAGEDREKIERMTTALLHRGPDGNATEIMAGASLGHTRLAILDPRPEGNQPMWNEDRSIAIVYNGEIYNYRKLREKHRLQCKTNTDTEVLLKLYEKHGMSFVSELIGMFAFAIYDTRNETWHLARDPSGIKPLFISYPENKIHFASEMRSLMTALPQKPPINFEALSQYIRLQYVPGPHTICEGIESLPPGTVLTWSEKNGETRSTVVPDVQPHKYGSKRELQENIPQMMDEAVKDHLISDKPLGIFLSGGMDSSILLHHMANNTDKAIKTFTVRFEATEEEGAKRFNTDADLAAMTAKHYGTDHHEIYLTAETCRDLYEETARSLDQPNADAVSTAQYILSREAKKEVDVVLTGAGGDELFGGYPRYRIAKILDAARMIPSSLRAITGKAMGHPSDVLRMHPGPALAERLLARPQKETVSFLKGDWYNDEAVSQLFIERFGNLNQSHPVRQFMEFDRGLWLIDESLRLTDAVTMGNGLECRVPFLDPRVITNIVPTNTAWHVGWKRTKALLKDTYRPSLPDHLFTLSKSSFYPPLAKWFRREAAPLVEKTIDHPRIQELFDTENVRKQFEDHKNGSYHLHTLSTLTQLRCWFDEVYDA